MADWVDKTKQYCDAYNIPYEYLAETLYEPKVIPMIRGKAFEFNALIKLQEILPAAEFEVSKEVINAQLNDHDVDVAVLHKPTGVAISVECKLGAKGDYRYVKKYDEHRLRVKCMRSRTRGTEVSKRQADILDIDVDLMEAHSDSYRPTDFDVVFTSIGNIFYITREDGIFAWGPDDDERAFVARLPQTEDYDTLKDAAFNAMYLATSSDLAVLESNDNECNRRNCALTDRCGFLPNYPYIIFSGDNEYPDAPWQPVTTAAQVMRRAVQQKQAMSGD